MLEKRLRFGKLFVTWNTPSFARKGEELTKEYQFIFSKITQRIQLKRQERELFHNQPLASSLFHNGNQ